MTKAHKEIALFLVQLAERENVTESQIVREVADKTQELLTHLRYSTSFFTTIIFYLFSSFGGTNLFNTRPV